MQQTWGTVFGGTILQNTLKARLPTHFIDTFGSGAQLTYAIIQKVGSLPAELRDQVRGVFADGLQIVWYTMLGMSALGLLSCLLMEEIPLRNALDESWGMDETACVKAVEETESPAEEK
jgi:hypothetical protein